MENNKYLVEDCFALTPRDVGWRYDRIRKLGINQLEGRNDITYWFDDMDAPTCLFVSVGGHDPQEFKWEPVELTFGESAYFYCKCGYKARKLFLVPNGFEFKCRICQKLKYRLSSMNPNSVAGRAIHTFDRMTKLIEVRENMARIFYKGKYTKRFNRFLEHCKVLGFNDVVDDAQSLNEVIQSQKIFTKPVH
ncbi:MAG: hypothetical protein Q8L47_05195 [bacterium]|nr:hypothetical protein [bacterium]